MATEKPYLFTLQTLHAKLREHYPEAKAVASESPDVEDDEIEITENVSVQVGSSYLCVNYEIVEGEDEEPSYYIGEALSALSTDFQVVLDAINAALAAVEGEL